MSDTSNTSRPMQRVSNPELFDGFRHLADFSQDAIYHYDIESRRFLFHNRTFRKFFQIEDKIEITATADQIIKAIHPEDRPSVRKALKQSLIAGQKEGEARYRVYRPDGAIRWLHDRWIVLHDQQGKSVAVQGFIHDNTRRKLVELQFLESKQNALIGSYIVQQGRFKYVNPKFLNITGFSKDELIDRDPMTLVREDYREHVRASAVSMLKGKSHTPYEFCVFDKSHTTHRVMETVTSVMYRGKPATLGYFMDITQLHEMKDNLSTLGLMLGTISHSLRGCLSGLDAGLYLIEAGFYRDRSAQIEEGLDVTKLMADRIRKLVLDILYYSKERDLEIEEVEIWRFAKEVAIQIETRIKAANIQFITEFSYDSGSCMIDPELLRAALINILENAMEACIEDPRAIDHWIRFTADVDKDGIGFEISDNGPGIDKEIAKNIFRLFSSSKGNRGTGIGLFVTRKAILKHGGSITVDSDPNGGTKFRINLPRKAPVQS